VRKNVSIRLAMVAGLSLAYRSTGFAQQIAYIGPASNGDWGTAANWNRLSGSGTLPAAGDEVDIGRYGTAAPSLVINTGTSAAGTPNLLGATLTVAGGSLTTNIIDNVSGGTAPSSFIENSGAVTLTNAAYSFATSNTSPTNIAINGGTFNGSFNVNNGSGGQGKIGNVSVDLTNAKVTIFGASESYASFSLNVGAGTDSHTAITASSSNGGDGYVSLSAPPTITGNATGWTVGEKVYLIDGSNIYGNPLYNQTGTFAGVGYTLGFDSASYGTLGSSSYYNGQNLYMLVTSIPAASGGPTGSTWNNTAAGDWNISTNWTASVPNSIGAVVNLGSKITAASSVYSDLPIIVGTINFNNSNTYVVGGVGTLTFQTSTGSASVNVLQGTHKISIPTIIASNTVFNVSSGATLKVSNPVTINAGQSLTQAGAGTVTYESTISVGASGSFALAGSSSIAALSLGTAATASIATHTGSSPTLLQTNSLTLGAGSALNLANNDLIVHAGSLTTLNAALASGYNNGAWNGSGIASTAAASDSTHLTALGSMQAASAGTFEGAPVSAGDVLLKYTYYGDATLDGKVDGSDYSRIDNGYLTHATGWNNGDFNYDNVIDGSDYTLIDNAFNAQGGAIASEIANPSVTATAQIAGSSAAAVPEPAAMSLLAIGAAGVLGRRRRK
jgi:hypothetical protein